MTRVVVAILVALLCVTAHAQQVGPDSFGAIAGRVLDAATGEQLPHANIILRGSEYGAVTDLEGWYERNGIPPGDYTVVASFMGYNAQSARVAIESGRTTTAHFTLTETVLDLGPPGIAEQSDRDGTGRYLGLYCSDTLVVRRLDNGTELPADSAKADRLRRALWRTWACGAGRYSVLKLTSASAGFHFHEPAWIEASNGRCTAADYSWDMRVWRWSPADSISLVWVGYDESGAVVSVVPGDDNAPAGHVLRIRLHEPPYGYGDPKYW